MDSCGIPNSLDSCGSRLGAALYRDSARRTTGLRGFIPARSWTAVEPHWTVAGRAFYKINGLEGYPLDSCGIIQIENPSTSSNSLPRNSPSRRLPRQSASSAANWMVQG